MAKTVTVFGSSQPGDGNEQYKAAFNLGKILAENGCNICTGGYYGIMEAVSKGASGKDIEVIGVTVKEWDKQPNKYLTKEIKCDTLFDRILKLIELGDAYVVMQGGTGTLLELAAVWELSNKNTTFRKPIACHSSMWQGIVSIVNLQMKNEGRETKLVKSFDSVEIMSEYIIDSLNKIK